MICRDCGQDETAGDFKFNPSHKNKGIHKHCHNRYSRNLQKLKRAKLSPTKWFQCDDCDEIFHIGRGDDLITSCRYCDSEEIMTFAEMEGLK